MSGGPFDTEGFYTFSSFNRPATAYRFDFKTKVSTPFRTPKIAFSPDNFITKQVFVRSNDGTQVPIFISHKKGLKISSETPLLLYGYGGFNISSTPSFSVPNLVWMEMGGIYVLACIRGGGEYGQSWHDQGKQLKKQNVFDDFIATAEYLIRENYTSSPKLAIRGGSNGGLLVGACMTQRPDLFGACIPQVGVMDMLRYHKFTIGWAWKSDYMSSETEEGFTNLMSYSPLHNIKDGVKYPPTLITTAERDDRVFPAHSYKFGAQLQYSQASNSPVLMRIETRAGHGAGKSMDMAMGEYADMWGFLLKSLRMELANDFPR
jgi:prolyl oligopeptidase